MAERITLEYGWQKIFKESHITNNLIIVLLTLQKNLISFVY